MNLVRVGHDGNLGSRTIQVDVPMVPHDFEPGAYAVVVLEQLPPESNRAPRAQIHIPINHPQAAAQLLKCLSVFTLDGLTQVLTELHANAKEQRPLIHTLPPSAVPADSALRRPPGAP